MRNHCGPAALATVLNYWGVDISQERIANDTFRPRVQATHGADLLLFAVNAGVRAYSYRGSILDLKRKAYGGMPIIVLQMSSRNCRSAHYRVVIGYDDRLGSIIVLDPDKDGTWRIPYRQFARLWRPCGRWALLVVPAACDEFSDALGTSNPVFHRDLATAHLHAGDALAAARSMANARAVRKKPGSVYPE